MEKFHEVAESQEPEEENEDATAAAGLLENLKVEDTPAAVEEENKTETEKKDAEEAPAAVKEEEKDSKSDKAGESSSST